MKMKLAIEGHSMEVEVGNLDAKPVVVMVDGDRFEVWPEDEAKPQQASAPAPAAPSSTGSLNVPVPVWKPRQTDIIPGTENAIIAPIPGVLVSVDVKVGDHVEYGQVVCTLEAMKMRNPIRAAKPGVVTEVKVKPGQHVHYHESMIIVSPEG